MCVIFCVEYSLSVIGDDVCFFCNAVRRYFCGCDFFWYKQSNGFLVMTLFDNKNPVASVSRVISIIRASVFSKSDDPSL